MEKRILTVATFVNMDPEKIIFMKPPAVRILFNHDWHEPPIGVAKLFKEDREIKAEIIWHPDVKEDLLLDMYPSIGGTFTHSETSNYITSGLIQVLGIGTGPNVDRNIRTLREQWNIPKPSKIITL